MKTLFSEITMKLQKFNKKQGRDSYIYSLIYFLILIYI